MGVSVSGEGSPQLRTCSDSSCSTVLIDWASSGTIDNSSYVQLRLTTSSVGGDTYSATLSVGSFADVWNVTPTGDCSAANPAVGTVCTDGTVYAGKTPDGNVKMYVTRCDAGQSWDGVACTGTRSSLPWNDGNSNWVTTNYRNGVTGEANTAGIAAMDANSSVSGNQDHVAAVYCNDLSQDGHDDWYLPATEELNVLYSNKDVIGNFGHYYWSSREYNSHGAYSKDFYGGTWYYDYNSYKNSTKLVRCVRK